MNERLSLAIHVAHHRYIMHMTKSNFGYTFINIITGLTIILCYPITERNDRYYILDTICCIIRHCSHHHYEQYVRFH